MSAEQQEYEALPQRASIRKKRRKQVDQQAQEEPGDQAAATAAAAAAAAAAAPAEVDSGMIAKHQNTAHQPEPPDKQQQQQEHTEDQQLQGHQQRKAQSNMPQFRSAAVGEHNFEYLDHTADVQLHAWGGSLREAFEAVGLAMFNYMTPIDNLAVDPACTREIAVTGHDLHSLLYKYLDELLFVYSTEYVMMKTISISQLDTEGFKVAATGCGEKFDRSKHECGTEVKAITYSAMQIRETDGDAEVFVIIDI